MASPSPTSRDRLLAKWAQHSTVGETCVIRRQSLEGPRSDACPHCGVTHSPERLVIPFEAQHRLAFRAFLALLLSFTGQVLLLPVSWSDGDLLTVAAAIVTCVVTTLGLLRFALQRVGPQKYLVADTLGVEVWAGGRMPSQLDWEQVELLTCAWYSCRLEARMQHGASVALAEANDIGGLKKTRTAIEQLERLRTRLRVSDYVPAGAEPAALL